MDGEKIISELIALFRRHIDDLPGANVNQEPYKGDFFRLFAAAYNAGLMKRNPEPAFYLRADGMRDVFAAQAPDILESKNFPIVYDFWREWTYAWDHSREILK